MSSSLSFLVKQPKSIEGGHSYIVNVTIQKQDISGVSKFQVELPDGFAIKAIETSGASFIRDNNIGKFVWINLPNECGINISYQLNVPIDVEDEYKITSTFYYLIGNDKKSVSYNSFVDAENCSGILSLQEINTLLKINPDKDIYYKVQLGAFTDLLDSGLIQTIYSGNKPIEIDYSNGNYIYTVGLFHNYYEAKIYQESCGVKDAFLVLFYMGKRIDKNMALEILNH